MHSVSIERHTQTLHPVSVAEADSQFLFFAMSKRLIIKALFDKEILPVKDSASYRLLVGSLSGNLVFRLIHKDVVTSHTE